MQTKVNNKSSLIYLLLCFLFLTSFINVLNTNRIISSNVNAFDVFSGNGGSEQSSMNSDTNAVMAAVNTSLESLNFSIRQLHTKTGIRTLDAIISVQTDGLLYYSRLSDRICTQLNSIIITIFLHNKDGMK